MRAVGGVDRECRPHFKTTFHVLKMDSRAVKYGDAFHSHRAQTRTRQVAAKRCNALGLTLGLPPGFRQFPAVFLTRMSFWLIIDLPGAAKCCAGLF